MGVTDLIEASRLLLTCAQRGYLTPYKVVNLLRNAWAMLCRQPELSTLPSAVILEPNNFCQLDCVGCAVPQPQADPIADKGCLDPQLAETILDDCSRALLITVIYLGGEPFLNRDLLRIVAAAHQRRVFTVVSTNGSFPTPDDWGAQVTASGLDLIIFSFSGLDQETHGQYHRQGSLEQTLANIRKLLAVPRHPRILLRYIRNRNNRHETNAAVRAFVRQLGRVSLEIREGFKEIDFTNLFANESAIRTQLADQPVTNHCHNLWFLPVVRWTGDVIPCCFFFYRVATLGSVREQPLSAIWRSPRYTGFRRLLLTDRRKLLGCLLCDGKMGFQYNCFKRELPK